MSDVAQLPTPTMATRSFAIFISLLGARGCRGRLVVAAIRGSFVFDELIEPCNLALNLLEPVSLKFCRVRVVAIALTASRLRDLVEPLGQARAAPLKNAKASGRVRLAEERETHVEC